MSKTSQENKAKKAKQKLDVEVQVEKTEQKAEKLETKAEVKEQQVEENKATTKSKKVIKTRSKKYKDAKSKIDVNKYYPLKEAIKLVKIISFSKFEGKIESHIVITETGTVGEINFPHLETSSKKVVILNDKLLKDIKDNKINFDILVATPTTMPKLLPLARVLGPKGLMPNPKNGTLTDKPEEAVKKLSAAKTIIKTEKKAPVIHIIVGTVSQAEKELEANLSELIEVITTKKIKKMTLCPTMGPSVKVEIK